MGILGAFYIDGIKTNKKNGFKQKQTTSYPAFIMSGQPVWCCYPPIWWALFGDHHIQYVPMLTMVAYNWLQEVDQAPFNEKSRQLVILYIMISNNSNNNRLWKHFEDSYATGSNYCPRTIFKMVDLLSTFKAGNNTNKGRVDGENKNGQN